MPWSPSNPPKRGGAYNRFLAAQRTTLPPSTGGVLALPITHDWGPFKTFVRVNSLSEFVAIFGQGVTQTPGYIAVYNAFKGENADSPGAGQLLIYRTGASSAAKATKTLQNTTPATAITLTAKYEGTRGNNLKVAVEANAGSPSTLNDLVIYEGSIELERYAHTKTDIAGLAASINALSNYFTAVSNITGTALAVVAAANAASGADGATLTAGEYTSLMAAFEAESFDVFAPYDLTDDTIRTSLQAWAEGLNNAQKPKRFTLVVGGAAGEAATAALTNAAAYDDENTVRVGVGTYKDAVLNVNLSTAQLAPRIAGLIARAGKDYAISFAQLSDLSVVIGPTDTEVLACIDQAAGKGGVVVLTRAANGVRVEKGINTYVSDSTAKPKSTFSRIKHVSTMQSFDRDLVAIFEDGTKLGKLDVNNDTREYVVGQARKLLDEYIKVGAIQAGASVGIAADPPVSPTDEFIALDWIAAFGRALEQVRSTFYVS